MAASTEQQLEATWRQLELDPASLEVDEDGTLSRRSTAPFIRADTARAETVEAPRTRVILGEVIAEGGMGVVRDAEQVSLSRSVAVKALKPALADYAGSELLREARVTGALEHPNVVPVHTLERDEDGRPLIVMKRLVGDPWTTRIERLDTRLDAEALQQELDVFEQVCNAVAFAHQHGVLHRDIKPDNVVLGSFGEVCLLDWGLAVGFGDRRIEAIDPVSEVSGIEGTLPYMAPEQVAGRGELLGPHTDIYLLGACLYHVLSGHAPHRVPDSAEDVRTVLMEIWTQAAPALPGAAPAELRRICERAMAHNPTDRFASAIELREAVRAYRSHRESSELATRAHTELAAAKQRIAAGDTASPEVGRSLAAARFGFEQALRSWHENQDARKGLHETVLTTARRELDVERPDAASALLAELPAELHAGSSLAMRIGELRNAVAERRVHVEALERAAHDADLGQAARIRSVFGSLFGVVFLLTHVVMGVGARAGWFVIEHAQYLAVTSALAGAFAIPAILMRKRLFPNLANRRFANSLGLMLLAEVLTFIAMWQYGVDLQTTLTVSLVQLAGSVAIKAELLAVKARLVGVAVLGCAVASHYAPGAVLELVGVAYATYFFRGAMLTWDDPHAETNMMVSIEDLHGGQRPQRRASTID
jgi:serine/threonine-protein kinase